ncbi:MAG: hypothetical protein V3W04_12275 [Gammaproteobacteria bacterium]
MRQMLIAIPVLFFLAGCSALGISSEKTTKTSSTAKTDTTVPAAAVNPATAVHIQSSIPFDDDAKIAANIKADCDLGKRLSDAIGAMAAKSNIEIMQQGNVDAGTKGKVLVIKITAAVSSGNAFIGHRKFASVKGALYNNGTKEAAFTGTRVSGGGFFGGYMSSCAVLGRTTKTIGKDIITWLENPVDGAHLGNQL